jgi:hypothetical protein
MEGRSCPGAFPRSVMAVLVTAIHDFVAPGTTRIPAGGYLFRIFGTLFSRSLEISGMPDPSNGRR